MIGTMAMIFVCLGFTELNRLQPSFHCVFHVFPFFVGEGALRRIFTFTSRTILTS